MCPANTMDIRLNHVSVLAVNVKRKLDYKCIHDLSQPNISSVFRALLIPLSCKTQKQKRLALLWWNWKWNFFHEGINVFFVETVCRFLPSNLSVSNCQVRRSGVAPGPTVVGAGSGRAGCVYVSVGAGGPWTWPQAISWSKVGRILTHGNYRSRPNRADRYLCSFDDPELMDVVDLDSADGFTLLATGSVWVSVWWVAEGGGAVYKIDKLIRSSVLFHLK